MPRKLNTDKSLYLTSKPIGIGDPQFGDSFFFDAERPARHCKICGQSFQPELARSPIYNTDPEVRLAVDIELKRWGVKHSASHTTTEYRHLRETGRFMTPEAAIKLIPLGIYPVQDLTLDEEMIQAGFEAKRAPSNDVPNK